MTEALRSLARGDVLGALIEIRRERPTAPDLEAIYARVEGRGRRDGPPPTAPPAEPRDARWAVAWAGDLEGAARMDPRDDADAFALRGIAELRARRAASALPLLTRALAMGTSRDVALHHVRAVLQLGGIVRAKKLLAALVGGESLAYRILDALVSLHEHPRPGFLLRRWVARARESHTLFNGLFAVELPVLVGEETLERACRSRRALAALLEGLLDRMAGNFGPSPTFAEPEQKRFVRLDLPMTSRAAATDALFSIRHVGADGAERALDGVLRRHPRSVHAHTYRGELLLWLGRYDEAARAFVSAMRIEPTRWAEIGLVAVAALTGRARVGSALAFVAAHHFPWVAGGTLPVYRGMLRRRTGDPRAIEDLAAAVAAKPSRVGARMELVLALRAANRALESASHADRALGDAPAVLVDAAEAAGLSWTSDTSLLTRDDVLEEALRSMRGNRSSGIVTWFRDGALRVLEPTHQLRELAVRALGDQPSGTSSSSPWSAT